MIYYVHSWMEYRGVKSAFFTASFTDKAEMLEYVSYLDPDHYRIQETNK